MHGLQGRRYGGFRKQGMLWASFLVSEICLPRCDPYTLVHQLILQALLTRQLLRLDKVVIEDRRRNPDFHSSHYSNFTRLDLRQPL